MSFLGLVTDALRQCARPVCSGFGLDQPAGIGKQIRKVQEPIPQGVVVVALLLEQLDRVVEVMLGEFEFGGVHGYYPHGVEVVAPPPRGALL